MSDNYGQNVLNAINTIANPPQISRENLLRQLVDASSKCPDPKIGIAIVYLKAGCDFRIMGPAVSDLRLDLVITHKTFNSFEEGTPPKEDYLPLDFAPAWRRPEIKFMMPQEELLDIAYAAIVPHDLWQNRDTPRAQMQLGQLIGCLTGGRDYKISHPDNGDTGTCVTDERTIWIDMGEDSYYLPTRKRLADAGGKDWY